MSIRTSLDMDIRGLVSGRPTTDASSRGMIHTTGVEMGPSSSYLPAPLGEMMSFPTGEYYHSHANPAYQPMMQYQQGTYQRQHQHQHQHAYGHPNGPTVLPETTGPFQPRVKTEDTWHSPRSSVPGGGSPSGDPNGTDDTTFATDVDTLMKAIQSKAPDEAEPCLSSTTNIPTTTTTPATTTTAAPATNSGPPAPRQYTETYVRGKKRYECQIEGCKKAFSQKTHLEIHIRAHTGAKPFVCREVGCGQRFSQLGNLKTHERRHTGERPFECDLCHKRFAQKGNVRAHRIVHEQQKPFICKLEDCGKQFTQLGNLKAHQNKFHAEALRILTQRFATTPDIHSIPVKERELFQYFAELYKNSNKGIKGRGKDRKIAASRTRGKPGTMEGDQSDSHSSTGSPSSSSSSSHAHPAYAAFDQEMDVDEAQHSHQHHHQQPHQPQYQHPQPQRQTRQTVLMNNPHPPHPHTHPSPSPVVPNIHHHHQNQPHHHHHHPHQRVQMEMGGGFAMTPQEYGFRKIW